jgi:hypothetical protein
VRFWLVGYCYANGGMNTPAHFMRCLVNENFAKEDGKRPDSRAQ